MESPKHHLPKNGGFHNPWSSFANRGFTAFFNAVLTQWDYKRAVPPPAEQRVQLIKPTWETPVEGTIRATWLGHAAFLIQMGSVNVLTDPVFSHRCSPSQWVGPARYTEPPCQISDLPKIDVVIISHNHYDHLDYDTIKQLGNGTKYFVPLGNKKWFTSIGFDNVVEMDWWDETTITIANKEKLDIVCTPCQHFSSRTPFDRNATLWSSWIVRRKAEQNVRSVRTFYFAGDTGYCSVTRDIGNVNHYDPKQYSGPQLPVCPVFKEIGTKFGPIDLACIPIGAYSPREVMSPVHCSPEDAVCVHQDVKSRKSIGMHWATWILTDEDPNEPPKRLRAEMERKGLDPDSFIVLDIGQSINVL